MSRWDADLQQWVEDDPPGRRPHAAPGDAADEHDRLHDRLHDPDEPEVHLLPGPPDGLPEGPSHAAILAGALAGVVLMGGLGVGAWALIRDDGGDPGPGISGDASPGASAGVLPSPGPSYGSISGTTGTTSTTGGTTGGATGGFTGGFTAGATGYTTGGYGPSSPPGAFSGTGSGAGSGSGSGPGSGRSSAQDAPAGFRRTEDVSGFRADVPQGWERTTEGASVFFKRADGNSLIQVFTLAGPEPTPYAALEETERAVSKNKGYRKLGLTTVGSPSSDAAELEYTYVRPDGTVRRIVDRAFTGPDRRQYALLVAGPADEWSGHQEIYRVLLGSFCPSGYCASSGGGSDTQ
ncbi:hypothetical protein ABZ543_16025 [Streptomyces roseifaciens]